MRVKEDIKEFWSQLRGLARYGIMYLFFSGRISYALRFFQDNSNLFFNPEKRVIKQIFLKTNFLCYIKLIFMFILSVKYNLLPECQNIYSFITSYLVMYSLIMEMILFYFKLFVWNLLIINISYNSINVLSIVHRVIVIVNNF